VDTLLTLRDHLLAFGADPEKEDILGDLAELAATIAVGQNRPTPQALAVLKELEASLDTSDLPGTSE
jgi:hypothetical protein